MTVREAFEKAYGPVPEGATCHVANGYPYEGAAIVPTYCIRGKVFEARPYRGEELQWVKRLDDQYEEGPDISDRPASAFLGFFGPEYDRVVAEDQAAWRAALHGARVSVSDAEDDGA